MSRIVFICCALLLLTQTARADLVTVSTAADVLASFDGATDSATSSADSDTLGAFVTAQNSFTDADQTWAFDTGTQTLTGSGLVITEKTIAPKPGGAHLGTTSLVVDFEIDGAMNFVLDGTFGFSGAPTGTDDSILYALTGPSGTVVSGSTTSTAGTASDSFSHSGVLLNNSGTGTTIYTLTISSTLAETINNQGTVSAGWNLTQFRLSSTAVPEPSGVFLCLMSMFAFATHRTKR